MLTSSTANGDTKMTRHATERMAQRGIPSEVVDTVIGYGRAVHTRGAVIHAVGRKEVERFRRDGIDLSDCEGVQVVCSTRGAIVTVYRNHDFRKLRSRLGRDRYRPGRVAHRRRCLAATHATFSEQAGGRPVGHGCVTPHEGPFPHAHVGPARNFQENCVLL